MLRNGGTFRFIPCVCLCVLARVFFQQLARSLCIFECAVLNQSWNLYSRCLKFIMLLTFCMHARNCFGIFTSIWSKIIKFGCVFCLCGCKLLKLLRRWFNKTNNYTWHRHTVALKTALSEGVNKPPNRNYSTNAEENGQKTDTHTHKQTKKKRIRTKLITKLLFIRRWHETMNPCSQRGTVASEICCTAGAMKYVTRYIMIPWWKMFATTDSTDLWELILQNVNPIPIVVRITN